MVLLVMAMVLVVGVMVVLGVVMVMDRQRVGLEVKTACPVDLERNLIQKGLGVIGRALRM